LVSTTYTGVAVTAPTKAHNTDDIVKSLPKSDLAESNKELSTLFTEVVIPSKEDIVTFPVVFAVCSGSVNDAAVIPITDATAPAAPNDVNVPFNLSFIFILSLHLKHHRCF